MRERMSVVMQNVGIISGLMLIGALMGVLFVMAIDPACGPSGTQQLECGTQILEDLLPGRR